MAILQRRRGPLRTVYMAALMAAALAACGGDPHNDGGVSQTATQVSPDSLTSQIGAPAQTGDTAADGFNWMNYRRGQAGVATLSRNSLMDTAARGHSNYQKINNTITHVQTSGLSGFTGANVNDRLAAAGYNLIAPYAYGEVISATGSTSGVAATEQLIAAIYHRFVILEPIFAEAGAGAATTNGGYTYFTTDFAVSNGYGPGIGSGKMVTYPFDGQTAVPSNFFSDAEEPDPVPDRNEVGYPISVHTNITSSLTVQSFSVRARGGADLAVRLLTRDGDSNTPRSAAAIVPLAVLSANTVYDVSFNGVVDGGNVSRNWSFTTK